MRSGGDLVPRGVHRWREAVSARLDGEDPGIDPALVDAHLARCPGCRAFASAAADAHRAQRVGVAPAVPDLSRRVRKAVALADRASRWSVVRALLVVVAVQIIGFSLPALIFGDEHETAAHAARHLGAFTAAYGVGLLVVAVRPARARTMLPVAVVLAGALVITADRRHGQRPRPARRRGPAPARAAQRGAGVAAGRPGAAAAPPARSARRARRCAPSATTSPTSPDSAHASDRRSRLARLTRIVTSDVAWAATKSLTRTRITIW